MPEYEEMERKIDTLLANGPVESKAVSDLQLSSIPDYALVVGVIFNKVRAEPQFCEAGAELVYQMKETFSGQFAGGTFPCLRDIVGCAMKYGFEEWQQGFVNNPPGQVKDGEDQRDVAARDELHKHRALAHIQFIGHLFVRKVLGASMTFNVAMTLLIQDMPRELHIEMVCSLLTIVGHMCEESDNPEGMLSHVLLLGIFNRLKEIKESCVSSSHLLTPSALALKRVDTMIQDLFDLRQNGWQITSNAISDTIRTARADAVEESFTNCFQNVFFFRFSMNHCICYFFNYFFY